jgi:hypothetical protein
MWEASAGPCGAIGAPRARRAPPAAHVAMHTHWVCQPPSAQRAQVAAGGGPRAASGRHEMRRRLYPIFVGDPASSCARSRCRKRVKMATKASSATPLPPKDAATFREVRAAPGAPHLSARRARAAARTF